MKSAKRLLGLLVASPPMVACIGVSAKPPQGAGAPIKKCIVGAAPAEDGLIDDFEDGNTAIANVGGRSGYWFKSADPGGSYFGPEDIGPVEGSRPGGDGMLVLHPSGATASGDPSEVWGAILGASLSQEGKGYDASRYVGISFWAKVAEGSTSKIRFEVADGNTHPDGEVCTDCWNHFGRDMTFSTEWEKYTVLFRSMQQQGGWGDPNPPNIDPSSLHSINWKIQPGSGQFEFYLDDVRFLSCAEEED